jgi:hypothetical protein
MMLGRLVVMAALWNGSAYARTTYYFCDVLRAYYPVVRTCPVAWRRIEVEAPQVSPSPGHEAKSVQQRDICNRPKVMDALFRALVSSPGLVGAHIESARTISSGRIRGMGDRQVTCEATIVATNGERIERSGIVTSNPGGTYSGQWAGQLVEIQRNPVAVSTAKTRVTSAHVKVSRVSGESVPASPPMKPTIAVHSNRMPYDEAAVIHAAESAMEQFRTGRNEMAKGASRPSRARAICSALPNRRAVWWLGTVHQISTNIGGMGILSIDVAPSITVETNNNSYYDDLEDFSTLIDPQSDLFATLSRLHKGDRVRFNGTFPPSEEDCIRESSLTLQDSVGKPAFIIRFDRVAAN